MHTTLRRAAKVGIIAATWALPALALAANINLGLDPLGSSGLGSRDVRETIASIINVFMGLLGTVAVVIILIGGFQWMTAGGNEEKVEKAKQMLTAGIIGLAIILAAYSITRFVVTSLINAT